MVAERYADGMATADEVLDTLRYCHVTYNNQQIGSYLAILACGRVSHPYTLSATAEERNRAVFRRSSRPQSSRSGLLSGLLRAVRRRRDRMHSSPPQLPLDEVVASVDNDRFLSRLATDVFRHHLVPVAFDPAWRTEVAVALARGMYESRDFAPMPVLADALDDAGCDEPDILAHCRKPGPHVRGCWVVDLVLGKA